MIRGYKFREYATFMEKTRNIKHGLTFFIGRRFTLRFVRLRKDYVKYLQIVNFRITSS